MATNVQLLENQSGVPAAAARLVGHSVSAADVAGAVSASQQGVTNVATVSATTTNPQLAAGIANAYVAAFIASQRAQQRAVVRQSLNLVQRQIAGSSQQQLAGSTGQALLDRAESLRILAKLQDGGVQRVTFAAVPGSPSSPRVKRNTALGFVLGLLLGLGVAFLLERLDRRMKDVDELSSAYGLPLLAAVPQSRSYAVPPLAASAIQDGHTEVFKLLRAYLRYFNVDRELRLLMVASAAPGDGKTTVARNLAQAAQETGTKTLLLEADLRRPDLSSYYGAPEGPGLSELLIGSVSPHESIRSVPIATRINGASSEVSLDVLLAGHPPPNPAELLQSRAMADILSWAAEHYELVVVDTPPLGIVSDAMALLRNVDGVVVVSQLGKNTRDAATFLRDRLVGVKAPLLGVVANGVKLKSQEGYGYGYYTVANGPAERSPDEVAAPDPTRPSV
jgi:receptor protein-tyrosine kinase